MGGILGGLISGASSLLGGFMNTSSQQAINTQNLQEQTWAAQGGYLPGLVANAAKAGLSPLAVLGQHAPSIGNAVGTDPGAGVAAAGQAIGQDITRAAQTQADQVAKSQSLEIQRQRLALDQQHEDIIASKLRNSQLARTFASPGSPPTYAAGTEGSPYLGPIDPAAGPHAGLTRMQGPEGTYYERSKEQAEQSFSGDPVGMVLNTGASFMRHFPGSDYDAYVESVRPDIGRTLLFGVNPGNLAP